jgi:parallel beta-helix repeat protein
VTTQQGGLLHGDNSARNLLLRDAPAQDFEIQTRVIFTPTEDFQQAGLLVYEDDDNFLKLNRAYCGVSPPLCAGNAIYFDLEEQGTSTGSNFPTAITDPGQAYLRLVRDGDVYTGYVSENGADWMMVGQHAAGVGFTPAKIGLVTADGSQGAAEIPADFDFFCVSEESTPTPTPTATSTSTATPTPTAEPPACLIYLPIVLKSWSPPVTLSILLGYDNVEEGLFLDYGGDVDTEAVMVGSPPMEARRTGNGQALPSLDGNQVEDYYMQLRADDSAIFAGDPTTRLRIEIEYFDQGTDTFGIQYDALDGGPFGDGRFKQAGSVTKTDTGRFQTAVFNLCDAYFANRDSEADFRIADAGDGAESIRRVRVTLLSSGPSVINVDSCGASPWDTIPDSERIQTCIDRACDGDTVAFTSGVDSPGYQGYTIDKTIFLVATTAKSELTFASTDPANHALLQATADLKGFVVRLFARSRVTNPGGIDDITISHLTLHGGRDERICYGADGIDNGVGDNWGSWLPECSEAGDPWCSPGGLGMAGAMDWEDASQDYLGHPSRWSTGLVVHDLTISNTECGTALHLDGAASTIRKSVIQTAGDHVHASGCTPTESDEGLGDWSDGITFSGPGHVITGNTVIDASDVGIVFFGGKDTIISNNTIEASAGNYGMFAGIAIHPWVLGDVSGVRVVGNSVTNVADTSCGGIHAGINIGTHMWGGGCLGYANASAVGNPNLCVAEPPQPLGTLCKEGEPCQEWAHVAAAETFTLRDNHVSGAQVNYLIEGLDLMGTLEESGNTSGPPRMTDWEADADCWMGGEFDTWGTIDRAAHHPTLDGWTDQRIHCER